MRCTVESTVENEREDRWHRAQRALPRARGDAPGETG
jgi:hypothetical protein